MKTPTRHAPHICDQVLEKIPPIWSNLRRPVASIRITTMIHDARIALPPTKGVQLKIAATVAPGESADAAFTCAWNQTMPGSFDHGPVQATTTAISTRIGNHP